MGTYKKTELQKEKEKLYKRAFRARQSEAKALKVASTLKNRQNRAKYMREYRGK